MILVQPVHRWWCPACKKEDVTHEVKPHSRFHICPKMRGLTTPMVPLGTKAKVTLNEREDYVGKDKVQLDPEEQRPIMNITVERENGTDVAVFAPTATANVGV